MAAEKMKQVAVRMEPSLQAAIVTAATQRGESFSEYIRKAAQKRLGKAK